MTFTVDTREDWPFIWAPHFSADVRLVRGTLETGDLTLSALPDAGVIERKSISDLHGCLGRERERFVRELQRSRYTGRLIVVVEGTMADLFCEARRRGSGVSDNSIIGSLASWQRLYAPFFFAGTVQVAAEFAERFLRSQIREIERASKALTKTEAVATP